MQVIITLWAPILLSAVFVFVVSSIIHMMLPYHKTDFDKAPSEDKVMEALRKYKIPPGDYSLPCARSTKEMISAEFKNKREKGPVAFITVMENGIPDMRGSLLQWFLYSILVGIFSGYLTTHAVAGNSDYLAVFRFSGTVAFAGYGLALLQNSIWYKRSWSSTFKSMFDGLIYALVTAGTFGWLWPQ